MTIPSLSFPQCLSGNLVFISFSDLETQNQIVARIEKEQELVNANKELIRIFEQKIKDRIAAVWGNKGCKFFEAR